MSYNSIWSTTDRELADAAADAAADATFALTRWQHYSTRNDAMAAVLNYDLKSTIQLRQSMRIYSNFMTIRFETTEP